MFILDQEKLCISSEIDLFNAVERYFTKLSITEEDYNNENVEPIREGKSEFNKKENSDKDKHSESFNNCSFNNQESNDIDENLMLNSSSAEVLNLSNDDFENLQSALQKIRFWAMTPKQISEGPARSNILKKKDVLRILVAITSKNFNTYPSKFSTKKRRY